MSLKRAKRKDFESTNREDFWEISSQVSKELIYWRKKYDIDEWFRENTIIKEQCSDELTKEKLEELLKCLIKQDVRENIYKVEELIKENDFINNVIFYEYTT